MNSNKQAFETIAGLASGQRCMVVISGDASTCRQRANELLIDSIKGGSLWVGTGAPDTVPAITADKAWQYLGREFSCIVFDAHEGLHIDALGAIAGTLVGNGVLVMLAPKITLWPTFKDPDHQRITIAPHVSGDVKGRFLERWVRLLHEHKRAVAVIEAQHPIPPLFREQLFSRLLSQSYAGAGFTDGLGHGCRTQDQERAVDAIIRVATGHRRRPLVMTSDRGRGKSAALGIAAAHLLQHADIDVISVTAFNEEAVESLFTHAAKRLEGARTGKGIIRWQKKRIEFKPPDALVQGSKQAQILFVDEAAAIPTPLLEKLLTRYSRVVFATTVHGYEGTGRGFTIRFQPLLAKLTPQWRSLDMNEPIRWPVNDPLEQFISHALLLDAKACVDEIASAAQHDNVDVERLDRDLLIRDEALLSELYGLMISAHYRTRPYDLRCMLDCLNVSVYVLRYQRHVIGVILLAAEGAFDEAGATAIWRGAARPHGHLLPESLAAHLGQRDAAVLRCARIMRIAVHPAAQKRGLGTRMLKYVFEEAAKEGFDYSGSSFGATPGLLQFWSANKMQPVRISATRGAASGSYSVLVIHPLTVSGEKLVGLLRQRFIAQLPYLLTDALKDLEPIIALQLWSCPDNEAPHWRKEQLDNQDWCDLMLFAWGGRVYESCIAPLHKFVCVLLNERDSGAPAIEDRCLVIARIFQKRDWSQALALIGQEGGRRQAIERLRCILRRSLPLFLPESLQSECRDLQTGVDET